MSGHSKWSTIKHKKAATDARRGKMFTKILKEITVAARLGGGDPKGNPRLRTALLEARSNSVPGDNIDRAIKKGTGELEAEVYEEIIYEGYGPGGVAVLVEAATDNRNRTAAEIRHVFARNGGNLGEAGCVGWMFNRRGYFAIEQRRHGRGEVHGARPRARRRRRRHRGGRLRDLHRDGGLRLRPGGARAPRHPARRRRARHDPADHRSTCRATR